MVSVLIYGCESWKGLKQIENRVRIFESGCLRKICNIRWTDHVSEDELRRRTGQPSVIDRGNKKKKVEMVRACTSHVKL